MNKVILICGKICSGKSYYARQLQKQYNAVILSTDEVTYDLIHNEQGEFYNIFAERVNRYLKKAVEIVHAGANVILDRGFWTNKERMEISDFFQSNSVPFEWHYVDDGLLNKLLNAFEAPVQEEMDVWYVRK